MWSSTIEDVKPTKKKICMKLPFEGVAQKFDEYVDRLRKNVTIKGFRKGRATRTLVLQQYGEEAKQDTTKELLKNGYQIATDKYKLEPVSEPVFTDLKNEDNAPFSFNIIVDVRPKFELKEYKGIEIEKRKVEVTDEDVEKAIYSLQSAFAKLEDIKQREVKNGDVVIIDVEAREGEKKIDSISGDNVYLELGRGNLKVEGMEKEIVGMKVGEKKSFEKQFPQDYSDGTLRNKKVTFVISLKTAREKHLPPTDDEFANKIDKSLNTIEDLRKKLRERIQKTKEEQEKAREKDEMMEKLLGQYDFDLPDSLVTQETSAMIMGYLRELHYRGIDIKQEKYEHSKMREKFEPEARNRVKTTFILLKMADKEKMSINEKELKEFISKEAQMKGFSADELYERYVKENVLSLVKTDALSEKVVDFLYKNTTIKEQ